MSAPARASATRRSSGSSSSCPQEWWIHVAQLDATDTIKTRDLRRLDRRVLGRGDRGEAVGARGRRGRAGRCSRSGPGGCSPAGCRRPIDPPTFDADKGQPTPSSRSPSSASGAGWPIACSIGSWSRRSSSSRWSASSSAGCCRASRRRRSGSRSASRSSSWRTPPSASGSSGAAASGTTPSASFVVMLAINLAIVLVGQVFLRFLAGAVARARARLRPAADADRDALRPVPADLPREVLDPAREPLASVAAGS